MAYIVFLGRPHALHGRFVGFEVLAEVGVREAVSMVVNDRQMHSFAGIRVPDGLKQHNKQLLLRKP